MYNNIPMRFIEVLSSLSVIMMKELNLGNLKNYLILPDNNNNNKNANRGVMWHTMAQLAWHHSTSGANNIITLGMMLFCGGWTVDQFGSAFTTRTQGPADAWQHPDSSHSLLLGSIVQRHPPFLTTFLFLPEMIYIASNLVIIRASDHMVPAVLAIY